MELLINNLSFGLLIWQAFLFLNIIFWLFCMVDVLRNSFRGNDKLICILVLLFVPIIGPFLYFLVGRKKRIIEN